MSEPFAFVIIGPPRTKGNSPTLFQTADRGIMRIPSKPHQDWLKSALMQAMIIKRKLKMTDAIATPISVRAMVYRERNQGDADNFAKAIGDFLQTAGFIVNDRQIVSWDGTLLLKDERNPRVEIFITPMEIRPIAG